MSAQLQPLTSCGILLSYRCTLSCRHCLYACGPKWSDWMEPARLETLLSDISGLWSKDDAPRNSNSVFQGVHLAGGEPFLRFEYLVGAVRSTLARGLRLDFVETSASWCRDQAHALESFRALRKAGLERVLISCSPFHAEKMPLRRTLQAVEAAREVFGRSGTIVYQPEFVRLIAEFGEESPVALSRYAERFGRAGASQLFWEGCGLISGGRSGFGLEGFYEPKPWGDFEDEVCGSELLESGHAHFDPYGNYVPSFCAGISLGRVESLPRFYETFDLACLPLAEILVSEGPWGLARWAMKKHGFEPGKGYAGKCHLCVDVRRHLAKAAPEWPELAPAQYYDFL